MWNEVARMNETLRTTIAATALLLLMFVIQSLPLLRYRSALFKVLPMVMFLLPLELIAYTAWKNGSLRNAVTDNLVILLPMVLGDIFGWTIGQWFRKILDAERAAGDTERGDDY